MKLFKEGGGKSSTPAPLANIMVRHFIDSDLLDQVQGRGEYLQGGCLSDYEYIHQCYKYDRLGKPQKKFFS